MLFDISGLSTESYVAWMKSTGCLITFLSRSAWSSSQFVRRWRYQFTGLCVSDFIPTSRSGADLVIVVSHNYLGTWYLENDRANVVT
jgi:hypothetical protein